MGSRVRTGGGHSRTWAVPLHGSDLRAPVGRDSAATSESWLALVHGVKALLAVAGTAALAFQSAAPVEASVQQGLRDLQVWDAAALADDNWTIVAGEGACIPLASTVEVRKKRSGRGHRGWSLASQLTASLDWQLLASSVA
jgi:hypothetical protein